MRTLDQLPDWLADLEKAMPAMQAHISRLYPVITTENYNKQVLDVACKLTNAHRFAVLGQENPFRGIPGGYLQTALAAAFVELMHLAARQKRAVDLKWILFRYVDCDMGVYDCLRSSLQSLFTAPLCDVSCSMYFLLQAAVATGENIYDPIYMFIYGETHQQDSPGI